MNTVSHVLLDNLNIGDRVTYRPSWGRGAPVTGTITGIGIEKGERVYDVRLDHGEEIARNRWGYAEQFDLIPERVLRALKEYEDRIETMEVGS